MNTINRLVDSSPKRTIPAQRCGPTLIAIAAGDQSAFADLDDEIAPHVFAIMTLLGTDPDPVKRPNRHSSRSDEQPRATHHVRDRRGLGV